MNTQEKHSKLMEDFLLSSKSLLKDDKMSLWSLKARMARYMKKAAKMSSKSYMHIIFRLEYIQYL